MIRIAGVGTALPSHRFEQFAIYRDILEPYLKGNPKAEKIFSHPGIASRHTVLEDPAAFYRAMPLTGARNAVYEEQAPLLATQAARQALAMAGFEPASLQTLVTTTCTGYMTPGLDILVAKNLGLSQSLRRYALGGMGCYAAFPALNLARQSLLGGEAKRALVVSTELCSLHLQTNDDTDSVISASLFADGASALALEAVSAPLEAGFEVVDTASLTLYDTSEHMTWNLGDRGFQMYLSSYVPQILQASVGDWLTAWLGHHDLSLADVAHWGIHPGGSRILDGLQVAFGLSDEQMAPSRAVLRDCGNMSSATIFFVLDRLLAKRAQQGEWAVLLAFGPGLTMEGALLRWVEPAK
jgi:predicted naringenin-chalcone synthase